MEITLSAEFEPLSIVAGCINASTGHFFQMDQDFKGDTIDPLKITRFTENQNTTTTFMGQGSGC